MKRKEQSHALRSKMQMMKTHLLLGLLISQGFNKFKINTAMNTSTPAKYSKLKTDLSTNISVPFKNLTFMCLDLTFKSYLISSGVWTAGMLKQSSATGKGIGALRAHKQLAVQLLLHLCTALLWWWKWTTVHPEFNTFLSPSFKICWNREPINTNSEINSSPSQ